MTVPAVLSYIYMLMQRSGYLFVLICHLLLLWFLGIICLYFHQKGKKNLTLEASSRWMCFYSQQDQRKTIYKGSEHSERRSTGTFETCLCMMDGAYYLNANKYWATNWLHFSSFVCCLWSLNDTKSNPRCITMLTSSSFFLWFLFSIGHYKCARSAWIFVLLPHLPGCSAAT